MWQAAASVLQNKNEQEREREDDCVGVGKDVANVKTEKKNSVC